MGLDELIAQTMKKLNPKKDEKYGVKFFRADKAPPLEGLIVDNPALEYILDRRFIPWGRFILVYGAKGSSKTTMFFEFAKIFQRAGGDAVWCETENARDLDYARRQGVDLSRLSYAQIDSLEEGLDALGKLIQVNAQEDPLKLRPRIMCFDSLAGVGAGAEGDEKFSMEDAQTIVGKHARVLSSFFRTYARQLRDQHVVVLLLNQLRDKIGMTGYTEESKESLLGGKSQLFFSTYHWRLQHVTDYTTAEIDPSTKAPRKIGSEHRLHGVRNKVGREGEGQMVQYVTYIDGGIDWYTPLVQRLKTQYPELVNMKGGGHYLWKGEPFEFLTPNGIEKMGGERTMSKLELAAAIANSPQAKEQIRAVFEIPMLGDNTGQCEIKVDATEEEIENTQEDQGKTRRRRKKEVEVAPVEVGAVSKPEDLKLV